MNDAIIKVEGLGKKYRIRHQQNEKYTTLRDVIASKFRNMLRPEIRGRSGSPSIENFWALKEVSFEVGRGEVLGLIGRNGAGKSTLLKILSRVTEPTEGRIEMRGRVASLLEVGTGFHPELTGRENIFLNGAILGMTRKEIRRKFDEIVAFAEVERFIDTPVKRYSSGMYVRLAFAVAAHLEPEILIVDEVLAVGDAAFQRKCLGRIKEVSAGGRTVLFVSHNLDTVANLCDRVALLASGRVLEIGSCISTISRYQSIGSKGLRQSSVTLGQATIAATLEVGLGEDGKSTGNRKLLLALQSNTAIRVNELALIISNLNGLRVGVIDFRGYFPAGRIEADLENRFEVTVENFDLVTGDYVFNLWLDCAVGCAEIQLGQAAIISESDSGSYLSQYGDQMNGVVKFRGTVQWHESETHVLGQQR